MGKLTDKDDKKAYDRAKEIAAISEFSPEYYSYLDAFASLLREKIIHPYQGFYIVLQPGKVG